MDDADDPDLDEISRLRARLADAEETLRAIREGEVDALLVADETGDRVYTLRSADAPYRALVEQMQEGAVTVTTAGDILYCNSRFAEVVDVPLERVVGASIDQFIEIADRQFLKEMIGQGTGNLRTRLRTPGGESIEVQISISSVRVDDFQHRTLIITDLSTLMKVQQESRSKDEFLAMLAHELRNPLGAIGSAIQVLKLSGGNHPSAAHAQDIIERQTGHMARLVDDLLDVGRVVTGKIALDLQPVDLAECARAAVAASSGYGPDDRIHTSLEPAWVLADPVRLEQVIGNLVANALKFSAADCPVMVSARAEGAEAVLQVRDEGSGIDAELLPRVFDLFVQGASASDRRRGGLGIGLTLVRRLVELLGGTIQVFSAGVDQGATFTVRLPLTQPAVTAVADAAGTVSGPGARVLLVDDNADSREMYTVILSGDGHEVHEAADGQSALEMFDRIRPDVAIVDIGLPGIDGYDLARRLRSDSAGAPLTLIALTGYGFPEDRERSRLAGFDRHLVKPADPEDLKRELDDVVRRKTHVRVPSP